MPPISFYRRGELARRLALFYAAQSIASAFGGLLAFGVFQIRTGALAEWRYLFIIEGSCTVLFSFFAFFYLPQSASTAKFLSQSEKELAYYRMQVDSSSVVNEKFNLKDSFRIFKHWTSFMILAIEICLGVPLQSVQLFLPQIVSRLGYSAVKTNLYTVAPNISGAVMLLVLAFASDFTRWRFPFVVRQRSWSLGMSMPILNFAGAGFPVHFLGNGNLCRYRCREPAARGLLRHIHDDMVSRHDNVLSSIASDLHQGDLSTFCPVGCLVQQ